MALPRTVVMDGVVSSMGGLEQLLRTLDDAEWDKQSRCDGWTVGDVARHAVGSMSSAVAGNTDGLGSPEVTAREVADRAGRSPAELADECAQVAQSATALFPLFDEAAWAAPSPGGFEGTLGDGVEALWSDFWIHTDDIRAGVGQEPIADAGLAGAVSHVHFELGKRGWTGIPPTDPTDQIPWVLAATGRGPAIEGLINIYA